MEKEMALMRTMRRTNREAEEKRARGLEEEVARHEVHTRRTETARGLLTKERAFAYTRSDALGVRLQSCFRRLIHSEVKRLAYQEVDPRCPCQRCSCYGEVTTIMDRSAMMSPTRGSRMRWWTRAGAYTG